MRILTDRRYVRIAAWSSLSAGLVFGFFEVTEEYYDGELHVFDRTVLEFFAESLRRLWLNGPAVEITALGSLTLTGLFSLIAILVLRMSRDRLGAIELATAMIGGGTIMALAKGLVARPRPDFVDPLVLTYSFSYPSGHSMMAVVFYLSLALIVSRRLARWNWRIALVAIAGFLSLLVGLSRIYLGVHYPSDVFSGLALGAAWSLGLHGVTDYLYYRSQPHSLPPPQNG